MFETKKLDDPKNLPNEEAVTTLTNNKENKDTCPTVNNDLNSESSQTSIMSIFNNKKYRILKELGHGAFSHVYLVHDEVENIKYVQSLLKLIIYSRWYWNKNKKLLKFTVSSI